MSDPELAARAQRAAERLEQSWDRWRRLRGLAAEQAQPVSSYVGYSLAEPWGRPRVVFGVGAEEAERLAALLEQDEGADPRFSQDLLWEPAVRARYGNGAASGASFTEPPAPVAAHAGQDAVSTPIDGPAAVAVGAPAESPGQQGVPADGFEMPVRKRAQDSNPDASGWTRTGSPPPALEVLQYWP
ncbi:MAG TPA: hypothetical protein VGI74_10185 [Streptosporangiaceae bacterium]|jgi:hypothetical protein